MNKLKRNTVAKITVLRNKENKIIDSKNLNQKTPDEILLRRGKIYRVIFASCNLR